MLELQRFERGEQRHFYTRDVELVRRERFEARVAKRCAESIGCDVIEERAMHPQRPDAASELLALLERDETRARFTQPVGLLCRRMR